jgi:phosphoglycerate dehydrogenase-like enzyme
MTLRVHFNLMRFGEFTDEFFSLLDPEIQITEGKEIPKPANFEILVHPTPSREWIQSSPKLKAVVVPWAGIPEATLEILSDYPDINLHNLHHNSDNTAEFGLTLLLSAAKYLIPMDQALRKNDWRPRYEPSKAIGLKGRKALVLGYGEIGKALARYCTALKMDVIVLRKHLVEDKSSGKIRIDSINNLHEILPSIDVMIVALPLTNETEHLIDEKEIRLMPKGGIIINVGRGPIINQHALYDALIDGHLRGAGSDVWYNYPDSVEARQNTPPADVPFGSLENFVMSPHRGGMVENVERQRAHALAQLLNSVCRGESIPNKVNISDGY